MAKKAFHHHKGRVSPGKNAEMPEPGHWYEEGYKNGFRFAREEADYDELAAIVRANGIPRQWDIFRAEILNRFLGDPLFDFHAYESGFALACIELYEKL
ncbi:MAG: hypothetical protein R6X08_10715 [Desulfosalsimonadaceae bacterium]